VDFLIGKLNIALNPGFPVPKINIDWKDGRSGFFSDLIGKTVVVDVWASWCVPCQKVLPEFNALAQEYKDNNDVVFVAMSIDSKRSDWEEAVGKSDWDAVSHCWYDREENPLAFNKPVPYSMVIDKKGIIRAEGNYIDTRAELEKVLKDSD
jgi:thiol-disulfide isomerase/thioredoxin